MRVDGSARISRHWLGGDRAVAGQLTGQIARPVSGVFADQHLHPHPACRRPRRGATQHQVTQRVGAALIHRAAVVDLLRHAVSWAYIASPSAAVWVDHSPAIPSGNGLQCTSRSALASTWRSSALRVSRRAIMRRNEARNWVTVCSAARLEHSLLDLGDHRRIELAGQLGRDPHMRIADPAGLVQREQPRQLLDQMRGLHQPRLRIIRRPPQRTRHLFARPLLVISRVVDRGQEPPPDAPATRASELRQLRQTRRTADHATTPQDPPATTARSSSPRTRTLRPGSDNFGRESAPVQRESSIVRFEPWQPDHQAM